jgi:hypothetical protein
MSLIVIAVILIIAVPIFLFVARRAVRLFIRLALVGVFILAILAGAFAWWWYSPGDTSQPHGDSHPANAKRSPSR